LPFDFRRIGRTKGGLNSKLHAGCDGHGNAIMMAYSKDQSSDHIGAKLVYPHLPPAKPRASAISSAVSRNLRSLAIKGVALKCQDK
jgi:hypothetical protein